MFELVSIVICTYNRSAMLADTLHSLADALASYRKPVEVLVVNNASTDNTNDVVTAFIREKSPAIALVQEHRKGLSYARNTGLERAKGDVICFLDDDVFVSDGWLEGLLAAFALSNDVGCVAGQIRLRYPEKSRPAWLDGRYNGLFSECRRGERSFLLPRGDDFIGANFALTRKAVSVVGPFNTALGRKQYSLLSGEDTEYAERLWKQGFTIAYSAEGYVYHRVLPERLTYQWIAKRYFWAGVTNSLKRNWFYPLSVITRLLSSSLLVLAGLLIFNLKRSVLSSFRVINAFGAFYGWYLRLRRRLTLSGHQEIKEMESKGVKP
jgi:glycosyltransferase involved in cell wall biosynthesis